MSEPAGNSFDGVVNDDGSVTISPDQLSRLSLEPGEHLTLVPARQRKSLSERGREASTWQRSNDIGEVSEDDATEWAIGITRDTRRAIAKRQAAGC